MGAGEVAASLILRSVCCTDEVKLPPLQILAVPDRLGARHGYLSFSMPVGDVRQLMNAWRVRARAAGRSPGDLTAVEQALVRRAKLSASTPSTTGNLHLFFPAYRFSDDGELVTVASRDHLRADDSLPALTFVDSPNAALEHLERQGMDPDWVLFDSSLCGQDLRPDEVLSWHDRFPRARHVCLVSGLSHGITDKLRGRGFRVCWLRDSTLATASEAIEQRIKCIGVDTGSESQDLLQLMSLVSDIRRTVTIRDGGPGLAALNALRSAIHVITSLPVDRGYYDAAAVERFTALTTSELLASLREHELRLAVSRPVAAAAIDEALSILSHLAERADGQSERTRVLLERVGAAIANGTGLCIVVRNRTIRSAVESCLNDAFDTNVSDLNAVGVSIETRRDLRPHSFAPSKPFLWTSYAGLPDLDTVIALSPKPVIMLLNQFEHEMLARDLRLWTNRANAAQQGTESLGVSLLGKRRFLEGLSGLATHVRSSRALASDNRVASEILRLFDDVTMSLITAPASAADEPADVMRLALTVSFESGARSYFPESSVATVLRAKGEEPVEVPVKELKVSDRVVFVDRTIGRTIYELMQEHLSESPLVGAAAQMVGLWHRAIATTQARIGLSPHEIHRCLRAAGSSITTVATVRSWLRGVVLGPQDLQDVDRLAGILGIGQRDPGVIETFKTSIRSLRNVYRQFAKLVYRTILSGGTGRRLSETEQALLEEHGISLLDLRQAIAIETVISIDTSVQPRPASLIGQRING